MITEWHPQSRGVNTNLPETPSILSNIGDKPPIPKPQISQQYDARKNGGLQAQMNQRKLDDLKQEKQYWKQKAKGTGQEI